MIVYPANVDVLTLRQSGNNRPLLRLTDPANVDGSWSDANLPARMPPLFCHSLSATTPSCHRFRTEASALVTGANLALANLAVTGEKEVGSVNENCHVESCLRQLPSKAGGVRCYQCNLVNQWLFTMSAGPVQPPWSLHGSSGQ